MVGVTGIVIEKWSEKPIHEAIVWIGDQEIITDENGRFSIDIPLGEVFVRINKDGYKEGVFSLQTVSETEFTLILEPLFQSL